MREGRFAVKAFLFMNRWLRSGAIALAAGCLMAAGVYVYASHSDPYRFSEQWVRNSAEVTGKIGEVKQTRFSVSGVFTDEFKGDVRKARVSTIVHGEKGSVVASLWLEKRGDSEWVVLRCHLAPS
jgi:hypothetical protein